MTANTPWAIRGSVLLFLFAGFAGSAGCGSPPAQSASAITNAEALANIGTSCPGPFKNTGRCISCATQALNVLKKNGQITGAQHGQLVSDLATNGCPPGCTSDPVAVTCDGKCGVLTDNCGRAVDCGTSQCVAPATCGGSTPNVCGCTPTTCQAEGYTCGTILNDGCGNRLSCGTCNLFSCGSLYDGVDRPVFVPVLPRPSNEGKHGLVETGYLMDGRGAPIAR